MAFTLSFLNVELVFRFKFLLAILLEVKRIELFFVFMFFEIDPKTFTVLAQIDFKSCPGQNLGFLRRNWDETENNSML